MTVKEKLYHLVNALPDANSSVLNAAEHYLAYLTHVADPVALACELAPDDDEPETETERAEVAEPRAELAAGLDIPSEQLKRELGL